MNKLSKVFRPFNLPAKNSSILNKLVSKPEQVSKGSKLLYAYGYIRHTTSGMVHVLPMGQRILDKLTGLVDREMKDIGAEKMSLPSLSTLSLWEKSDTYEKSKEELYHIVDREGKTFILNPTYEQAFSHLLSNELVSYRDLPKLLYQVSSKFRDEHKPKAGLLRGREFVMKDLYSFDINQEEAEKTYDKVTKTYDKIFSIIGIPTFRIDSAAESGVVKANEYYYKCNAGDDKIYTCPACKQGYSAALLEASNLCPGCSFYKQEEGFARGLEVAHTFYFGSYFSDRLGSCYVNTDSQRSPLHLCSYGIGLSRVIGAVAEVMCTEENELRWPLAIAPYSVCVIPPKDGSRESLEVELLLPELYQMLEEIPTLRDDIIVDDRGSKTIGKRMLEAKHFGFPFIVVAGKDAMQQTPLYELYDVNNNSKFLMPKSTLIQYLLDRTKVLTKDGHRRREYIDRS